MKKNKNKNTKINNPKKTSSIELFKADEIVDEPNAKVELFDLESILHYLMVRMNHMESIQYDFNILLNYHRLKLELQCVKITDFEMIKMKTNENLEFEGKYPFIKEWYFVCIEFLTLIRDLTEYHEMLDKDCFDYKKELKKNKEKILKFYTKEEYETNKFHFASLNICSKTNLNKIIFSSNLTEKALILQNKFFHIIYTIFEYYPLPKSVKIIDEYYNFLFKKAKITFDNFKLIKDGFENKNSIDSNRSAKYDNKKESENSPIELNNNNVNNLSESKLINETNSTSFFDRIFSCFKKNKRVELDDFQKFTKPLLSLDLTDKSNKISVLIKAYVYEFSRLYLKVEEMVYKEICES